MCVHLSTCLFIGISIYLSMSNPIDSLNLLEMVIYSRLYVSFCVLASQFLCRSICLCLCLPPMFCSRLFLSVFACLDVEGIDCFSLAGWILAFSKDEDSAQDSASAANSLGLIKRIRPRIHPSKSSEGLSIAFSKGFSEGFSKAFCSTSSILG